ncbi:MAG TPA: hypothetical protein VHB79_32250 [Polyangiaceae bacterium]|nr:hypothetical protein [Polyangiaceae bacterium]
MKVLALGVLAIGLSLGRAACAQTSPYEPVKYSNESSPSVAPWQQPNIHWYGASILAADAVGYAAVGAAFVSEDVGRFTAPVGVGMLLPSGPITHVGHYRWGAAGASLGLRVGLALAGAWAGAAAACDGDTCSPGPLIGLTAAGMLMATTIDAAFLSYERLQPSVGVMPTLSLARNRIMLGASRSF